MIDLESLDFSKGGGTVTVVAQDDRTGRVLMVAAADREAIERTISTGEMHYRSRSRGLWHKGATSGNVQRVVSLTPDCDGDAVLARVVPAGPACHRGTESCFDTGGAPAGPDDAIGELDRVIAERMAPDPGAEPPASYTRRLLLDRNLRLKKLGEESAELVLACADGDRPRAVSEAADVLYHLLVAVRAVGGSWEAVLEELRSRRR
jgi:phosphoribosyl-AMP cyclohydrolase / phosphoribosyl-ATP pyrophosphohydrolase